MRSPRAAADRPTGSRRAGQREPFLVLGEEAGQATPQRHASKHADEDVGQDRQPVDEVELLEDDADVAPALPNIGDGAPAGLHVVAMHGDAAARIGIARNQASNMPQERRLARARGADERHHFARHDSQRLDIKRLADRLSPDISERFRQLDHVDRRFHAARTFRAGARVLSSTIGTEPGLACDATVNFI